MRRLITKKILFLDIDGVLNSVDFMKRRYDSGMEARYWHGVNEMDHLAVKRLFSIIEQTRCHIVISSTWRKLYALDEIQEMLDSFKYSEYNVSILGRTPVIHNVKQINGRNVGRGVEIKQWLEQNITDLAYSYTYCIVDDDSDMLEEQLPYFVQTNNQHGLLDEHVERIVEILNK